MTDDIFSELKLMLANISNLKLETLSEFFKNKVLIYEVLTFHNLFTYLLLIGLQFFCLRFRLR